MRSNHLWFRRALPAIAACGITLALGLTTFRAQADTWDKKTVVTVNQPFQVQDTYLEPGTYVFKLASSNSDRHIVQIFDRDQRRLINTFLAIPNYRLQPTGNSKFSFYETPAGSARALRAWFYPGDNFGQEFRYPKHLRQVATLTTQRGTVVAEPATTPVVQSDQPEVKAVEQAVTATPQEEEKPREVAMLTTPEAPEPAADTPAPEAELTPAPAPAAQEPAPATSELPKTASTYPLLGLCGLLSLTAVGLLRLRRSS